MVAMLHPHQLTLPQCSVMTDSTVNTELRATVEKKKIHLKTILHSLLWMFFAFKYVSRTDAVSVGTVKVLKLQLSH